MLYNLVEVVLASPRTITINMDSVEKFGDFIRRRERLYNSYIKMTKKEPYWLFYIINTLL